MKGQPMPYTLFADMVSPPPNGGVPRRLLDSDSASEVPLAICGACLAIMLAAAGLWLLRKQKQVPSSILLCSILAGIIIVMVALSIILGGSTSMEWRLFLAIFGMGLASSFLWLMFPKSDLSPSRAT